MKSVNRLDVVAVDLIDTIKGTLCITLRASVDMTLPTEPGQIIDVIRKTLGFPPVSQLVLEAHTKDMIKVHLLCLDKNHATLEHMHRENHALRQLFAIFQSDPMAKSSTLDLVSAEVPPTSMLTHDTCVGEKMVNINIMHTSTETWYPLFDYLNANLDTKGRSIPRRYILEFWSTTCPTCPKAIAEFQDYARKYEDLSDQVMFVMINTKDPEFGMEIIEEEDWDLGHHMNTRDEEKERVKAFTGMKTHPHPMMVRISIAMVLIERLMWMGRVVG